MVSLVLDHGAQPFPGCDRAAIGRRAFARQIVRTKGERTATSS